MLTHLCITSQKIDKCWYLFLAAVTCTALKAPSDGSRQGCTGTAVETYNTVCLFSCSPGFNGLGSPSRKCLHNGTWSGQEFICKGNIRHKRVLIMTNKKKKRSEYFFRHEAANTVMRLEGISSSFRVFIVWPSVKIKMN